MPGNDFSIGKIIEKQVKSDAPIFVHEESTDWLSYTYLGINIIVLVIFSVYFLTHMYHHSIQKSLNKLHHK
jgi:hypothetical protein